MAIFSFGSYREIIEHKMVENARVRGYKSRVSEALRVPNSYLSHVLRGSNNLSLDQAAILCDFWGLGTSETDYFLTLVSLERASNPLLRERIQERVAELKAAENRFDPIRLNGFNMELQQAIEYLSDWKLPAIHAAINLPGMNSAEALSASLEIALPEVKQGLKKLEEIGLVAQEAGGWRVTKESLSVDQKFARNIFHNTMREKAKTAHASSAADGAHFSMLCTVSKERFQKLKEDIIALLKSAEEQAADSPEEDVAALVIDFFRLNKN